MTNYSLIDRISKIADLIMSSSFYVSLLVIMVLTIIVLFVNHHLNKKLPRYLTALAYVLVVTFVLFKYGKYVLYLNDNFVTQIFAAMYFPNPVTYMSMITISILFLIRTLVQKKYPLIFKIGNIICFGMISILFILILERIKQDGVDINDMVSIYSNETLLILIQASTYIFFIWTGILLMKLIVEKLTVKLEEKGNIDAYKEYAEEYFNETYTQVADDFSDLNGDIVDFTEEEFKEVYQNHEQYKKESNYRDIMNHNNFK